MANVMRYSGIFELILSINVLVCAILDSYHCVRMFDLSGICTEYIYVQSIYIYILWRTTFAQVM